QILPVIEAITDDSVTIRALIVALPDVVIAVALGESSVLQGNDPPRIERSKDAVEPIAIGRHWPRRLVARKRGERGVDRSDDLGFIELSRRVHLLTHDLNDAIALFESATNQAVDLVQGVGAQWHGMSCSRLDCDRLVHFFIGLISSGVIVSTTSNSAPL